MKKKLIALKLDGKAIARKGYAIAFNNTKISTIASGSWSPTLNQGIALAYLPIELIKPGTKVSVLIREKWHNATVTKKPFYRRVS